jgi:hypothetical protein
MNSIIQTILNENNDYLERLESFKIVYSANHETKLNTKNWIKDCQNYLDFKSNTIYELEKTINALNSHLKKIISQKLDEKSELIKIHDLFGLTNGKYYDFAINPDIYIEKEPELYNLIKLKLEKYLIIERQIKNT